MLSLKTSRYNAKKVVGVCEKCGTNMGTEVHHVQHQASADQTGFIHSKDAVFHKNNLANLMTVCEACHKEEHKKDKDKDTKPKKGRKSGK